MKITIETSGDHSTAYSVPIRHIVTSEKSTDDLVISDVVDMVASCLIGMGYHPESVAQGMADYAVQHLPEEEGAPDDAPGQDF